MKKVGIITDSGASLEYMHFKHNIKVAGIPINFGEEVLLDGKDTNAYTFYDMIDKSDIIPSTSAPFHLKFSDVLKNVLKMAVLMWFIFRFLLVYLVMVIIY